MKGCPIGRPILYAKVRVERSLFMETFITDLFMKCVYILQVMGGAPGEYGYGYYLANIIVFVIVQPGLILLFFLLWRRERRLRRRAAKTVL